ncbi:MAG TPA: YCF48-related protein, partial [Lacipirellulaceae bacterium]
MTCQDGPRFCVGTLRGAPRHALLAAAIHLQLVGLANAQTAASAALTASAVPGPSSAIGASLRNDATLADIFFADRMNGWAVGDRGVIWHTADGGATWQQQASGVWCHLNAVYFIDSRRGWVAGGENRPHARSSQGVVLQTIDGGATWSAAPNLHLPLLSRIKFFNPNVGVAVGAGSAVHPSGVFVTHDGGANWQPLPADKAGHWSAGDFLDDQAGAVAASAGEFATIAQHRVKHSPLAMPSMRAAHAMRLVAPAGGWLVGDGGLMMTTADLGHTWQSPPGDLPQDAAEHFDFHALAVQGEHIWIAGSPGTGLFHSPDGGKSWQAFATGQRTPIRALTFIDTQHGWAAGDLGCILSTRDGGQTWQRQRAGGSRAALLAVFPRAGDVPLELLAEQGAAEGYIAAVDLLYSQYVDDRANDPEAAGRAREAMILAGAASAETAWRFPLPHTDPALTPADLLAALNRANDGRAIERLERHLVRTLRMWRPDVIIVPHATQNEGESMTAVVEDLLRRSVEAAADPTQFVELTAISGLDAWQVKKVYGVLPRAVRGHESVVMNKFSPWLGSSLADWVAPARRLLSMTHSSPPDTHELNQLFGEVAADFGGLSRAANGPNGIFRGIALARGSEARRAAPEMPSSDLEDLRRMATRRKHLQELLKRTEGNVA